MSCTHFKKFRLSSCNKKREVEFFFQKKRNKYTKSQCVSIKDRTIEMVTYGQFWTIVHVLGFKSVTVHCVVRVQIYFWFKFVPSYPQSSVCEPHFLTNWFFFFFFFKFYLKSILIKHYNTSSNELFKSTIVSIILCELTVSIYLYSLLNLSSWALSYLSCHGIKKKQSQLVMHILHI